MHHFLPYVKKNTAFLSKTNSKDAIQIIWNVICSLIFSNATIAVPNRHIYGCLSSSVLVRALLVQHQANYGFSMIMCYTNPHTHTLRFPQCRLHYSLTPALNKVKNVTSAGWQLTPCDPVWHVSSHSSEAG